MDGPAILVRQWNIGKIIGTPARAGLSFTHHDRHKQGQSSQDRNTHRIYLSHNEIPFLSHFIFQSGPTEITNIAAGPHLPQGETPLEGSRENVVRVLKGNALRFGDWCWKRFQERAAGIVNFPAQEHGVIFMDGVMAMLHEHAAKIAE